MDRKTCSQCHRSKLLTEYSARKLDRGGGKKGELRNICEPCRVRGNARKAATRKRKAANAAEAESLRGSDTGDGGENVPGERLPSSMQPIALDELLAVFLFFQLSSVALSRIRCTVLYDSQGSTSSHVACLSHLEELNEEVPSGLSEILLDSRREERFDVPAHFDRKFFGRFDS